MITFIIVNADQHDISISVTWPALPRVGEFLSVSFDKNGAQTYQVIDVLYKVDAIEVYVEASEFPSA